jgi:hypothetical protein
LSCFHVERDRCLKALRKERNRGIRPLKPWPRR